MNGQDKNEFVAYLRGCTDSQVYGVLEKESVAGRVDYADLAKIEVKRRYLLKINARMRWNRFWSNSSLSDITVENYIAVYLGTPEPDDVIVLVQEFGLKKGVSDFRD